MNSEMNSDNTYDEIARSYRLWSQYVDPHGIMTQEEFDSWTVQQRLVHMEACFGVEEKQ